MKIVILFAKDIKFECFELWKEVAVYEIFLAIMVYLFVMPRSFFLMFSLYLEISLLFRVQFYFLLLFFISSIINLKDGLGKVVQ